MLDSNVPALRFPEFTGDWESKRIGNHTYSSAFGPRFSSDLYSDTGNVVTLRTTDMEADGKIDYKKAPRAQVDIEQLKEHLLSKDDLVISRSGTIGITGVFDGFKMPVIPGAFLIRFRIDQNELNSKFIQFIFNSDKGRNTINSLSAGGVQKNLTGTSILNLFVDVPSLPEQQKIASFLTAIDAKIELLTKKKSLLEQYKKGVMQQLFSQQIRFKDEEGNDFPEWQEKTLGEIAPLQRGFDLPVDKINEGNYPVVFSNGVLKSHNEYKAKGPGVITGRSGTIGKVTYVEKDYWPHNTALWVTNFNKNFPKYVFYFYSQYNLERFATGSGVPTLNRNDIHSQQESFPCYEEQRKITTFLDTIVLRTRLADNQIESLKSYKKGLLQQLFV